MTDRKSKTESPPDAIPRRYRDQLVPACGVGVPDPIAEASEQLRVAGLAAEAAVRRPIWSRVHRRLHRARRRPLARALQAKVRLVG